MADHDGRRGQREDPPIIGRDASEAETRIILPASDGEDIGPGELEIEFEFESDYLEEGGEA